MGDTKKPIDTVKDGGNGFPEISELQYEMWVTAMSPWLRMGSSIRRALTMAGLTQHKDVVYRKYRDSEWFRDRIDELRSQIGEMVNETVYKAMEIVSEKIKQDRPLTETDLKTIVLAMKHRTAQPFFVERQESAIADPKDFGKVVESNVPLIEYLTPIGVIEGDHATETAPSNTTPASDQIRADAPTAPSVETAH